MATLPELEDALRNADKAGDSIAATRFADEIVKLRGAGRPPVSTQDASFGDKAVSLGKDALRQVGLTARYGLNGMFGQPAELLSSPWHMATSGVASATGLPQPPTATQLTDRFSDWIGLPKPAEASVMDNSGKGERIVGDIATTMAGAGSMAKLAGVAAPYTSGATNGVLNQFAANPGMQVASAAGSGAAGGYARENGVSPVGQFLASMAGGVAAPIAASTGMNLGKQLLSHIPGVSSLVAPNMQAVDSQIQLTLGKSGIDWKLVDERVRNSVREDVRKALTIGDDLDSASLRRLIDLRAAGITPTRGMVTLDPVQVTREKNAAKAGANSADPTLQTLPRLEADNNTKIIEALKRNGNTDADPYAAGKANIDRIQLADALKKEQVGSLYDTARAMPGGEVPLNRSTLLEAIDSQLAQTNKAAFLPDNIRSMLNTIAEGQTTINGKTFPVPFDAKALDNLMTVIATAQRGTADGNVKSALSAVRKAIEETPIAPVKNEFGGNQLVTEAGANFLKSQDAQAGNLVDALGKAREAHRNRMNWQESSAPVSAAIDGAQPDNFIKKFVINGTVADAEALAKNGDPTANKAAILSHLKSSALNGASDEVGKFGASAFNKALSAIGDRKLAAFGFTPDEIQHLHQIGRAGSYMLFQGAGTAVNNSNSGAMIIGKALDALMGASAYVPFAREMMQARLTGIQQGAAQRVAPTLVNPGAELFPLTNQAIPASIYAGLLASSPVPPRKDERSR